MIDLLPFSVNNVQFFVLIFTRVISMVSLLPILGSNNVPVQIKVGLSLMLAMILFPLVYDPSLHTASFTLWRFFFLVIREVFVGIVIGFAASFLFVAIQFAGHMISRQMGFAFVRVVDPLTQQQVTSMGQLMMLVFSIVFLLINGHYFMIMAVERSFEVIPLLGARFPGGKLAFHVTTMITAIFIIGLKMAAPVFVTLFITTVALGIVARTVPQMNVFFVGLPLRIGLGFGVMIISLPLIMVLFKRVVDGMIEDIWLLIRIMGTATA